MKSNFVCAYCNIPIPIEYTYLIEYKNVNNFEVLFRKIEQDSKNQYESNKQKLVILMNNKDLIPTLVHQFSQKNENKHINRPSNNLKIVPIRNTNSDCTQAIRLLEPYLTSKKFKEINRDPIFLEKQARVCEECYIHLIKSNSLSIPENSKKMKHIALKMKKKTQERDTNFIIKKKVKSNEKINCNLTSNNKLTSSRNLTRAISNHKIPQVQEIISFANTANKSRNLTRIVSAINIKSQTLDKELLKKKITTIKDSKNFSGSTQYSNIKRSFSGFKQIKKA